MSKVEALVGADQVSIVEPLQMPTTDTGEQSDLHEALRTFHFTGERTGNCLEEVPSSPLRPAVLQPWSDPRTRRQGYPLYLPAADEEEITPLAILLNTATNLAGDDSGNAALPPEQLNYLIREIDIEVFDSDGPADFKAIFSAAVATLLSEHNGDDKARDQLTSQLTLLEQQLPSDGLLLGLGNNTLLQLYAFIQGRRRRATRNALREELETLIAHLEDELQVDRMHSPEGATPDNLSGKMGSAAARYVDSSALAKALPGHRGTRHMAQGFRQRIGECLEVLKQNLSGDRDESEYILLHSSELPEGVNLPSGSTIQHADCFAEAQRLFDQSADQIVPFVRALRTARLEVEGRYEPAIHDAQLARFNRNTLTNDELKLVRAIVILESERELLGDLFSAYSHLLQSGRAIDLLVLHDPINLRREKDGRQFANRDPGLGYRSVAHREAYVVQTTLVQPTHLVNGLEEMVRAPRPAVAFVGGCTGPTAEAPCRLQSIAEHLGRASPCFAYNPDAGETWAASFVLSHNTQSEEKWPRFAIPYFDQDRSEKELLLACTFADYTALDATGHDHICTIPQGAWSDEQMELSAYLELLDSELPRELPYIWVVDLKGQLQRALVTRELAFACLDGARLWRVLQELGGIRNEYAKRAAENAREETARDMAESKVIEKEKIRAQAATDTINRLVSSLLGIEPTTPPIATATAPAAKADKSAPADKAREEPQSDESPAEPVEDPYIETVLCTTCDECTNINPQLFEYDDNKQAYIADATAGTFAELVKAAELCPAACIHPGVPRADDKSATAKLLKKAAEFN